MRKHLGLDPVVLGCLNNMAQINLQYGIPTMRWMLTDALTRGKAALAATYGEDDQTNAAGCKSGTRRLRRKLFKDRDEYGTRPLFARLRRSYDSTQRRTATSFAPRQTLRLKLLLSGIILMLCTIMVDSYCCSQIF
jgi:hypothetical protein